MLSDEAIGVILCRWRSGTRQRGPRRLSCGEIWPHALTVAVLFGGAFPTLAIGADATVTARPAFVITVRGERLSVALDRAPLGRVLSELARKAKIHVEFPASIQNDLISERFDNLPLEQGISRLLLGRSFAVFYDTASSRQQSGSNPARMTQLSVLPKAGRIGSARVAEDALNAWDTPAFLQDPDPKARLTGLDDYAQRRDTMAINTLAQAMLDPDETVRDKAQLMFNQALQ